MTKTRFGVYPFSHNRLRCCESCVSRDASTTLGRRCTIASCAAWPVIFISVRILLALRQSVVPLSVVPRCRRNRRDATRRLRLDTGAHLCTSLLCVTTAISCCVPLAEGRERAACAMSPVVLTTAGQAIVLFRSQTSPFLFHAGFAVLPASLLFSFTCPNQRARSRERSLSLSTLRSDIPRDCTRDWARLEPINFAMRRIPRIRDRRLMDSVYHWPILFNKISSCWITCQFYFVLYSCFPLETSCVGSY